MTDSGDSPQAPAMARTGVGSLRDASREELERRVLAEGGEWAEPEAVEFLRNPFVDAELIRFLLRRKSLLGFYTVKKALVFHPATPQSDALRLVPHVRWHDLMQAGLDFRVSPVVRRACDKTLIERLPELALGERISLARAAGRPILARLRFDPDPMVFSALLNNPRLVEEDLVSLVASGRIGRPCLELLGRDRRWSLRPAIRLAMLRNSASPPGTVVGWVSSLRRDDLLALWRDPRTPELVRQAAKVVLEARLEGSPHRHR